MPIVRASKFRHVFGTAAKPEECFNDLRLANIAWDSNFVCANQKFWAVLWEAGGGGSFAVLPLDKPGKVDPNTPLISGHTSAVLDIDFNPFNPNLIASVSEDCRCKVWGIPEGGLTATMTEPLQTLQGHKRKVGVVKFHPGANNIMGTAATDFSVKVWDIEKGLCVKSSDGQHTDIIQSMAWNYDGSQMVTSCKDKKLRVLDPRAQAVAMEGEGHVGVKGSRAMFVGKLGQERIFSVGFTRTSEREYCVWDPKALGKPLVKVGIDTSAGILMPFYDPDVEMIYLAGKGDGNIRYFEYVSDDAKLIYSLSEYKSSTPARGMCFLPKLAVNVSNNEIARALKLTPKVMEPISFTVPRKSDLFQDDIFPDCFSDEPAMTADEWLSGKSEMPKTMSLAPGFVKKERSLEFNPVVQEAPKELSEKEMKEEIEKLTKRVAYLEAEIVKKDAKIKELEGSS